MKKNITVIINFYLSVFLFLISSEIFCKPISLQFAVNDFDQAAKSDIFIRFDMKSTKLGLMTSEFHGYVKKFSINGEFDEAAKTIVSPSVTFNVEDMDTDVSMRNSKMFDYCLDYKNSPTISLIITDSVVSSMVDSGKEEMLNGKISIRGSQYTVKVNVKITSMDSDKFKIEGNSKLSLSQLKIPDPSIVVATVNDNVDVSFKLVINK